MRILVFLAPILCAVPALAQPQAGAQMFPAQPAQKTRAERMSAPVPLADIEREIKDFARRFGSPALTSTGEYGRLAGNRAAAPAAVAWARETQASLHGAELRIDKVRVLPRERVATDATTRALISYHFDFPATVGAEDRQGWERPRQEVVRFDWKNSNRDPDVPEFLDAAKPFADYGWEFVPPTATPLALEAKFYASDADNFWANVAYHLAPTQVRLALPDRALAKLRQLAIGAQWLAQEHQNRYELAPDYIRALMPYVQNAANFQVPDSREFYTVNSEIVGLSAQQIAAPENTVLFYDGMGEQLNFRYDNRAAICFADGHAALVSADEAKSLIWKP